MNKAALIIVFFISLHFCSFAQDRTRFVIIDSLSNVVPGPEQSGVRVVKVDLKSERDGRIRFPVFNIFYTPAFGRFLVRPCDSCMLKPSFSKSSNILFASFSILPTARNEMIKKKLSMKQVMSLNTIKVADFREELVKRLKTAIEKPDDIALFSTKSIAFKVIVREEEGYYLYDNLTLTECYRMVKNDQIYYPIDNDNITINTIARPFSRTEFAEIFKEGVPVVADGFLTEDEKTLIDRHRLSNRIYREKYIDSLNVNRFWYLPFNTISSTAGALRYMAGIGVFDFNNCYGILGGSYYSHFNKKFEGYLKDQSIFDETYLDYFVAYKINNVDVKTFLEKYPCRKNW